MTSAARSDTSTRRPPRRVGPWKRGLGVGLALALVLVGAVLIKRQYFDSMSGGGPLGLAFQGGHVETCVPEWDREFVEGSIVLRNPSSKHATIRAISLARPEGVTFVEAFVTDIENQTLIGISPWPLKLSFRTESWEKASRCRRDRHLW